MISFNVRMDLKPLMADLTRLEREQLPFATARALTDVARQVAASEQKAERETFDRPTPFTQNAFAVIPATKRSQTAKVLVKDIQAAYLAPYIVGGPQALGSKQAILTPRSLNLNQYGNIPRNKIAALKGKSNVFIGTVKFKSGKEIAGVWQRGARGKQRLIGRHGGKYGAKGKLHDYGVGQMTSLKLLVQFTRPSQVTHRFPFGATAQATIRTAMPAAFDKAMASALATAK